MEDRVAFERAVIAEKLAVGAFRLHMAARIKVALQHPFGVGGDADIVADAFHHRERRVAQRRHQPELVDRQAHDRGDMIDRMRADDEAHG